MVCPQGHRCGLQGGGENQVSEESSLWTACLSFRQWHEAHSDCNTPLGHKEGAQLVSTVEVVDYFLCHQRLETLFQDDLNKPNKFFFSPLHCNNMQYSAKHHIRVVM